MLTVLSKFILLNFIIVLTFSAVFQLLKEHQSVSMKEVAGGECVFQVCLRWGCSAIFSVYQDLITAPHTWKTPGKTPKF